MSTPLTWAAILEAFTGAALIAVPSLVVRLLLGAEVSGAGVAVTRVAGIGLFSLGLACWPRRASTRSAWSAMLTYNLLLALYLTHLGLRGQRVGVLLWPAAAAHAVLTILLVASRHAAFPLRGSGKPSSSIRQ